MSTMSHPNWISSPANQNQMNKIYFAAPFFSDAEREFNERILRVLESWIVFYPYRDGRRMAELVADGLSEKEAARLVWQCDFEQLQVCNVVVAVLDGRVPDEGVCVELGIAACLGKTVVGLLTDCRSCFRWGANPLITSALTSICHDPAKLNTVLLRSMKREGTDLSDLTQVIR
jgi:nucleoside 2-deoxyribosyltransferase